MPSNFSESLSNAKNNATPFANENTSGMGKDAIVPEEVAKKFNWGVFWLTWIWGIGNSVWITLLTLVACIVIMIPIIGPIIYLVFLIWLGVNGNKLAWQSRRYESIESFHKTQKTWGIVGLIISGGLSLIGFIAAISIPMLLNSTSSMEYTVGVRKAVSVLNQAAQLNVAKDVQLPNIFDSETLTEYFAPEMRGKASKKSVTTSDGVFYQFDANGGDCTQNNCRVLVDLNGTKNAPNKYWEKAGAPSDRIVLYIERKNEKGFSYLNIPMPEIVAENK